MKIWLRIFILSASAVFAAIAIAGTVIVRAGYHAQLAAEVRSLLRVTDAAAVLATNAYRTSSYLSAGVSSPSDFVRRMDESIAEGAGMEVYTTDLELLHSEGHVEVLPGEEDSPELPAAAAGRTTWILRRRSGELFLYLAVPERVAGETLLFRSSARLASLDAYGSSQMFLLVLSGLGAALLVCGVAFIGSRAIVGGLEGLSAQAAALAGGNYAGRIIVRGGGEVAHLGHDFNRMADAIERAMRSRQAFIDDLTHELRTPVTSIVGFADLLRRRAYDEAVFAEGLRHIHDEGRKILAISEGLKRLLLARTGSPALVEVEVAGVLEHATADARLRHPGHVFEARAQAGARLAMDRDLMLAALANLLDNGARASPRGSTVTVRWIEEISGRKIIVRDPGGAVEPAEPGLGLGKAICREIADYHGARLEYEEIRDGGTSASIIFPNLP